MLNTQRTVSSNKIFESCELSVVNIHTSAMKSGFEGDNCRIPQFALSFLCCDSLNIAFVIVSSNRPLENIPFLYEYRCFVLQASINRTEMIQLRLFDKLMYTIGTIHKLACNSICSD